MKAFEHLATLSGVLAAGEFSYRGDGFRFAGLLEPEQARMAAAMCRATTESVRMQTDLIDSYTPDTKLQTPRGWVVTAEHFTVCVVGPLFCFLDNAAGSLNPIIDEMQKYDPVAPPHKADTPSR